MFLAQNFKRLTSNQIIVIGMVASLLFTLAIYMLRPLFPYPDFLPDTGAAWYYWKLPDPTFWTRFSAWAGYLAHQLFFWGLIYWAQKNKDKLKYINGLHGVNVIALVGSALFIVLHMLQTAFFYDGLAQDTAVFSSQGSVIILLVVVLILENKRRGLFFGKKVKFVDRSRDFFKHYHGYIFSWGIIYTFWFHPMEDSFGHLFGFFYTYLLMVQASLMFTRAHLNKYWTALLEVTVLFHGTTVALVAGQTVWPMFMFGFLAMFVITQMHGLGWSKTVRWIIGLVFIAMIVAVYSGSFVLFQQKSWVDMNEVLRIPIIDYVLVFVFVLLGWGLSFLMRLKRADKAKIQEAQQAS
jgi:hypothetical protein